MAQSKASYDGVVHEALHVQVSPFLTSLPPPRVSGRCAASR